MVSGMLRAAKKRGVMTAYIGAVFVNLSSNLMGWPASSRGTLMLKQCRTDAMVANSGSSAKYRPGQIL